MYAYPPPPIGYPGYPPPGYMMYPSEYYDPRNENWSREGIYGPGIRN